MNDRGVGLEVTELLLLLGIQPPLTTSLFWRLVEAAIVTGHRRRLAKNELLMQSRTDHEQRHTDFQLREVIAAQKVKQPQQISDQTNTTCSALRKCA